MFEFIQRHPLSIKAHFDYSLVLTYAYPAEFLSPLLPPGLTLDTHAGMGFLAIALVQTRKLRPVGMPAFLGRDFFLSGCRIFVRHQTADGRIMRGLRILRSDTNSAFMVGMGNLLTHYHYRKCTVVSTRSTQSFSLSIKTANAEADLELTARLDQTPTVPPAGSPFADLKSARHFAGPLPFTFDYEAATHSLVIIKGMRSHWEPRPIEVDVRQNTFLQHAPFAQAPVRLANAFFIENVPYRWARGIVSPLPKKVDV